MKNKLPQRLTRLLVSVLIAAFAIYPCHALNETSESTPARYFSYENELLDSITFARFANMDRPLFIVQVLEHSDEQRVFNEWPTDENGNYIAIDTEPIDSWQCTVKSLHCEIIYSAINIASNEIVIECMDKWESLGSGETVNTPWTETEYPAPGQRLLVFNVRDIGLGVASPEALGEVSSSNLVYIICEDGRFISCHGVYGFYGEGVMLL